MLCENNPEPGGKSTAGCMPIVSLLRAECPDSGIISASNDRMQHAINFLQKENIVINTKINTQTPKYSCNIIVVYVCVFVPAAIL